MNDGVVTSSQDTVNGNWTYTYDSFNRLATSAESNQSDAVYNYQYDRFGNRWQQNLTGGSGYNSLWNFNDYTNQISSYVTYDAAGNTMSDSQNAYTYDAENRLISIYNSTHGTYEYAYDALGHRVEKLANNVAQEYYLFDLAGREVTRLNAAGSWLSGEVYAGGKHLATYGDSTTTFDHSDWLGTERYRTTVSGAFAESCQSLPFADGFSCTGGDMSPLHFTGKEHDYESNLENFDARFYSSQYGRFITPDWAAKATAVPYAKFSDPQTLNLYGYVRNNPISKADTDGHCGGGPNDPQCDSKRTEVQVTNIVYNESNGLKEKGDGTQASKEDLDKDIARAIINGDDKGMTDKQRSMASDTLDSKNADSIKKSDEYKQTAADVHCACQDAKNGAPDPTGGSVYFNNRDTDSTSPRDMSGGQYQPLDIQHQDGPFVKPNGGETWETYERPEKGQPKPQP